MPDCQLYLISPPRIEDVGAFQKVLSEVLDAVPVAAFQLRLKDGDSIAPKLAKSSVVVQAAEAIFPALRERGCLALVNDSVALAVETGADGVHLGQGDGTVAEAREALGADAVVGVTCHGSRELAFAAVEAGADYVAFGAFFPTQTKVVTSDHGGATPELELIEWWHEAMTVPCVAIGGITAGNAAPLVAAGADFLAVSSGVWGAPEPVSAARELWRLCQGG